MVYESRRAPFSVLIEQVRDSRLGRSIENHQLPNAYGVVPLHLPPLPSFDCLLRNLITRERLKEFRTSHKQLQFNWEIEYVLSMELFSSAEAYEVTFHRCYNQLRQVCNHVTGLYTLLSIWSMLLYNKLRQAPVPK